MRVCRQRIGRRSGSQFTGSDAPAFCAALSNKVLQTRDWENSRSDLCPGKILWDYSCRHRLRQLPCASVETNSGGNPVPQRQVTREIFDQLSKPASSFQFCTLATTKSTSETDMPCQLSASVSRIRIFFSENCSNPLEGKIKVP